MIQSQTRLEKEAREVYTRTIREHGTEYDYWQGFEIQGQEYDANIWWDEDIEKWSVQIYLVEDFFIVTEKILASITCEGYSPEDWDEYWIKQEELNGHS